MVLTIFSRRAGEGTHGVDAPRSFPGSRVKGERGRSSHVPLFLQATWLVGRRGESYRQVAEAHAEQNYQHVEAMDLQGAPAMRGAPTERDSVTQQPDERFAARFRRLRTGCLKEGSVTVTTGIDENNSDKATGLLLHRYEGDGRTKYDPEKPQTERVFARGKVRRAESGKYCFCDCLHYRQYLQGRGWTGPVNGAADNPISAITSGIETLALDGQWHEENLVGPVLGTNVLQTGCQREFTDTPGVTNGAATGVPMMLRYNFYLQIWDACQQQEIRHDERSLTIGGNRDPRAIVWALGHRPLSRTSIRTDLATPEQAISVLAPEEEP